MPFPPRFLDELRERVSLAELVGRRVKLTRRGRDFVGLCPFHKEKTPSFNVVEDKGFYHCFGCGAHGDVIGFTMQTGNLGFLETVEALARQAGLEMPRASAAEREQAQRQASLQGALEAACAFFEAALAGPAGREARRYLERRGLDQATIRRFRVGYAPDGRDQLKRALGKDFPEAMLIEAGLLRRPEDGGDSFDYFRNRVVFPIGDRSGRPIAFGGRVLGDGQPKYLNSPETPLFQKGRTLYAWAQARAAAAREPSAIVVEGYMDVIALHRAGFATAVAPLGTALTEAQIEALWRLAPEPILCFDGDAAGQRAAGRALERALPLLRPGLSLRFAALPQGEDPDTLVLRHGAEAMTEVLARARPLAEVLWAIETAHPADTPERRAALEQRLDARVRQIADRGIQEHYRQFFRERVFAAFRGRRGPAGSGPKGRRFALPAGPRAGLMEAGPPPPKPLPSRRRQQEIMLAVLVNHPFLLNDLAEEIAALEFWSPDLDKLRGELLRVHALTPDLDAVSLKHNLSESGFAATLDCVLSRQVFEHAAFARAEADAEAVRVGWRHTRSQFQQLLATEIKEAERDLAENMNEETWGRLQPLLEQKNQDDGATDGEIR